MHFFLENGRLRQFFRLYIALFNLFLILFRSNDFNKEFVALMAGLTIFFFPPLIRCSLRSRLCLCSAKFLYRMGSAYRLHRRTCYTKKESPRRISEVLKVAATSSPTIFRSAVPSAMLSLAAALAPLRSAVSRLCPLRCSPSLAPSARRRRAHRHPPL